MVKLVNLSITACSFSLSLANTKKGTGIINLNHPLSVKRFSTTNLNFSNAFGLLEDFFKAHADIYDDKESQRLYKCEYKPEDKVETDEFVVYPVTIKSGVYGSSSDIIDSETKEIKYNKKTTDADFKQFYLMVVFPKDNSKVTVQRGLFIFQNIGSYGIKTVTTERMKYHLSYNFRITLTCNTISPSLFLNKMLEENEIKEIRLIKHYTSSDAADNLTCGYGEEMRVIRKLDFKNPLLQQLKESMKYMMGGKNRTIEFENIEYNKVKPVIMIGDRQRTFDLSNLENVSIIEALPNSLKGIDGNPDKDKLIEYLLDIIISYLKEMSLEF